MAGGPVVGMVSTRFAGTDGVTLEAAKLAEVLGEAGHRVVWFAGELGERFRPGRLHPPAHFESEANRALEAACFGVATRSPATTTLIRERTEELKGALRGFLGDFGVDLVVAQNVLCLPMQLPLGLALTEVLVEEGLPLLAHHHDFWWERERFFPNAAADVLGAAFPPLLERAAHLVINSAAGRELARRRAIEATVLPNVMDFERGPRRPGDGARYRQAAGLAPGEVLLLQPTRVVPRKWIEATIELAARLPAAGGPRVTVAVTHAEGDEGRGYGGRLRALARARGVDLRFVPAGDGAPGGPDLADAYAAADLVCFPSAWEGFGNALLEAAFHRRPLLVNRYPVYAEDIAPAGFRCIELDGAVTPGAVAQVRDLLAAPDRADAMVEADYRAGLRHFSYATVRERVLPLVDRLTRRT
ncbi:MAG TPA: glycosyltransferase family 4 protein [Actinomycetota bacterium]